MTDSERDLPERRLSILSIRQITNAFLALMMDRGEVRMKASSKAEHKGAKMEKPKGAVGGKPKPMPPRKAK